MYRTIIVGTDGSESGQKAVASAIDLAAAMGSTLHVVSVVPRSSATARASDEAGAGDVARAAVDASKHAAEAQGITCETHTPHGDVSSAILELAEAIEADLIVVGNRGMTGIGRFLGSVPSRIAHHAPCSTLIVETS